jgi:hypothetical protein
MTKAQKTLNRLYGKHKTWSAVAKTIKVNKGVVYAVAKGKIPATPQVCKALGLPIERHAPAPVCPKHGIVHTAKRCPKVVKTFEQNCAAYETWKEEHTNQIREILSWALRE